MKQLKRILLFFTLLLVSCSEDFFEKPIDIDIDTKESKLAGTAILGGTSPTNLVFVSFSKNPFDTSDKDQVLENAKVTLSNQQSVIIFQKEIQRPFYSTNSVINFIPKMAYTLTIEAPNYKTIKATQFYPEKVSIQEASINENTFKIKINDNPNQKDYYLLKLKYKGTDGSFYDDYIEPFGPLTKESGFCSSCVSFTDVSFNGKSGFEIVTSIFDFNPNRTYKAVLYHITEDFYKYDTTLRISDYAESNLFVEPVILHHNFDNGYGIFALVNTDELLITP